MATDTEKLSQIVEFLAEVRTILDGGWHYSSPLIRREASLPQHSMLVERPDALGIVADVVVDLDAVSGTLFAMAARAAELGVDTVDLCGADLGLLARVYQALAQDVSTAANKAVSALTPATKPERKRGPRSKPPADGRGQTSLLESEPTTSEGASS
jgi:hypothetical protein